jgi:AcrR family transcriptional regulator
MSNHSRFVYSRLEAGVPMGRKQHKTRTRTPSQQRARDTVDAIVQAAAQVFARHGYAAGTTNRIAERAGVSVGSVYQYFPNKDALLTAVHQVHQREARTIVGRLLDERLQKPRDLEDQLRAFLVELVAMHTRSPALHRVLFEEAPRPASVQRSSREFDRQARRQTEALLRSSPELDVPHPACAAFIVSQTVECLAHQFALHQPPGVDERTFVDEVVVLLGRYLQRSQPAKH